MSLKAALGLESGQMLALIGAGGKTTTLFRLAKELRDDGGKILVTTTTKIFKPTKPHVDRLFLVEDHVLQLVKHPLGCLKGIPAHCRKVALLNQADSPDEIESAKELGRALLQSGFERAIITSYLSENPVKAVIAS